jgi:hypothetical protein
MGLEEVSRGAGVLVGEDPANCRQRNVVERLFCRFKDWRRAATRFVPRHLCTGAALHLFTLPARRLLLCPHQAWKCASGGFAAFACSTGKPIMSPRAVRIGVALFGLGVVGCFVAATTLSSGPAETAGSPAAAILAPAAADGHPPPW